MADEEVEVQTTPYVCPSCGHEEGAKHEKGCIYSGPVTAL